MGEERIKEGYLTKPEGKRAKGRPKLRWQDDVEQGTEKLEEELEEIGQ